MAVVATDVERYSSPTAFAREVNLPLLGSASLPPLAAGASLSQLLEASTSGMLEPIVENLAQTRQSLTLRSLLLAGFPHDPECFALGLALGRAWSRRGLKVAVVDVDGWNPTIIRGVGEPAEGLADVLEYGCSFQRVAWEVVAGSLWVVGPGTHPLDEARLAEHPEWDRAARAFAARADVTLYVAPLLQRQGVTGRLSKRMDGVLLTASVDRVNRAELRDAFLELWGSDAPIIGCVSIESNQPAAMPVRAAEKAAPPAPRAPAEPAEARPSEFGPEPIAELETWRTVTIAAPRAAEPSPSRGAEPVEEDDSALVDALEREVRSSGIPTSRRRPRSSGWLLGASVGVLTIAVAGVAGWFAFVAPQGDRTAATPAETRTSGEESVLPAPDNPPPAETPEPPKAAPPGAAAVTAMLASGSTPLSTAPPAEGKSFRVHVASFRSEEKVAPIVRDLRLKGLDAWFETASDGSGWYRVFVGRFATEDEAAAYASWLLRNKWVDKAHAFPSTSR